jgi:hypothetical protein
LDAENRALNEHSGSVAKVIVIAFYDWYSQKTRAQMTVQGRMKSSGHRKNILAPYWLHESIDVAIAPDDSIFKTQDFC